MMQPGQDSCVSSLFCASWNPPYSECYPWGRDGKVDDQPLDPSPFLMLAHHKQTTRRRTERKSPKNISKWPNATRHCTKWSSGQRIKCCSGALLRPLPGTQRSTLIQKDSSCRSNPVWPSWRRAPASGCYHLAGVAGFRPAAGIPCAPVEALTAGRPTWLPHIAILCPHGRPSFRSHLF
jgi:hypothetical protein